MTKIVIPAALLTVACLASAHGKANADGLPLSLTVEQVGGPASVPGSVPLRFTLKAVGPGSVLLPDWMGVSHRFGIDFGRPKGWTSVVPEKEPLLSTTCFVGDEILLPGDTRTGEVDLSDYFSTMLPGRAEVTVKFPIHVATPGAGKKVRENSRAITLHATFPVVLVAKRQADDSGLRGGSRAGGARLPLVLRAEQIGAQAGVHGPVLVRLTIRHVGEGTATIRGWDPQLALNWVDFDEPRGFKLVTPKGMRLLSASGVLPTSDVLAQEFVVSPSAPLSGQLNLRSLFLKMLPGKTDLRVTVHVEWAGEPGAGKTGRTFQKTALRATFPVVLTDDRPRIGEKRPR
jgi:hypothetical protein